MKRVADPYIPPVAVPDTRSRSATVAMVAAAAAAFATMIATLCMLAFLAREAIDVLTGAITP